MKFTLWAVGAPLLLFALGFIVGVDRTMHGPAGWFWVIGTPWFWVGLPCTVIYWIVRLVRHAWRDGSASSSARPAGWIYPDER